MCSLIKYIRICKVRIEAYQACTSLSEAEGASMTLSKVLSSAARKRVILSTLSSLVTVSQRMACTSFRKRWHSKGGSGVETVASGPRCVSEYRRLSNLPVFRQRLPSGRRDSPMLSSIAPAPWTTNRTSPRASMSARRPLAMELKSLSLDACSRVD